jgi:hypothetical protein
VLSPDNIWNTPVDTPLVLANSATMVTTTGVSRGFHAEFGAGMWDGGPASFLYDDESGPGPYAVGSTCRSKADRTPAAIGMRSPSTRRTAFSTSSVTT